MKYVKVEQHLYEGKNRKVRIEYHCFIDGFTYTIKAKTPKGIEKDKVSHIYHF